MIDFHLYNGTPYPYDEYKNLLYSEMNEEYLKWTDLAPPKRFIYLVARIAGEFHWSGFEELSTARVRDRGFDFQKVKNGLEFKIVRHFNAHKAPENMIEFTQHWRVNIKKEKFVLLNKHLQEETRYSDHVNDY